MIVPFLWCKEVQMALKEGLVTSYADWKKIDEEEMRRGNVIEKERERMGWDQASKFLNKYTLQDDWQDGFDIIASKYALDLLKSNSLPPIKVSSIFISPGARLDYQ